MKNILVICSFFLLPCCLSAQYSFALGVGSNWSTLVAPQSEVNFAYKEGFYLAFTPHFQLYKTWRLLPSIQFSTEGYQSSTFHFSQRTSFSYLRFSPQVEYAPRQYVGLRFGPNIGFKTSDSDSFSNTSSVLNRFRPIHDALDDIDFGLALGARFYMHQFFINFNYYQGLYHKETIAIFNNNFVNPINGISRNSSFQIGIGYVFQKK